ncbi:MAG: RHS repeat-associated core domain-containing protein, partial [Vicinamibacteria bacterium]
GRSRPTTLILGGRDSGAPAYDYRVDREYDPATGRMNAYRVIGPKSGEPLLSLAYSYDELGFVTAIDDLVSPSRRRAFVYDGLGRLVTAAGPYGAGGAAAAMSFAYDAIGNLLSRGDRAQYLFTEGRSLPPHAPDAMTLAGSSIALEYDLNGSLTRRGDRALEYGFLGRLRRVSEGSTILAEHFYDFLGRRMKTESSGGVTYYAGRDFSWKAGTSSALKSILHDGKILATVETFFSGRTPGSASLRPSWTVRLASSLRSAFAEVYLWLPFVGLFYIRRRHALRFVSSAVRRRRALTWLVAAAFLLQLFETTPALATCQTVPPGALRFYFEDHRGDTILIAARGGAVIQRFDFGPFGEDLLGAEPVRAVAGTFVGKEEDEETGLYDFGSRWYDPELARFITPERIVADPFNPQSLNRYAYALNNPLNLVDPSGDFFFLLIGVLIAAVASAASAAAGVISAGASFLGSLISAAPGFLQTLGGSIG